MKGREFPMLGVIVFIVIGVSLLKWVVGGFGGEKATQGRAFRDVPIDGGT